MPGSGGQGSCVSGSHRTVTTKKTVLSRLLLPGHHTDSRLKHTPGLPVKEAYLVVLELQPERQALDLPHHLCALPQPCYKLLIQLRKKVYALLWSTDSCNCHPGVTSRSPIVEASRV